MKTKQTQIKKPIRKTVTARKKVVKPVSSRKKITPVASKKTLRKAPTKTEIRAKAKQRVKKVLVPHAGNGFRPHLIRLHGIIGVLVVALMAQTLYGYVQTGQLTVLGRVAEIQTVDILKETNKEREKSGTRELNMNDELSRAAFLKAQNMFSEQYWAHVSPSGTQPWKWFGDVGYNYSYAGENLAKKYPNAAATVDAWMNSETHRANMLNGEYVDVGFAVVDGRLNGENTTIIVALYGSPVTVAAVESATSVRASFAAPEVSIKSTNPLSNFGSAIEALSPMTIAILGLIAIIAIVGVVTHHYRRELPKAWKKSWRIHSGLYTFVGMVVLGVLVIVATGGGQI